MGIPSRKKIENADLGFECQICRSHLARACDAIKGDFFGPLGPAVFISKVINVDYEPRQLQNMCTGKYIVRYVTCRFCHSYLGWSYVRSFNQEYSYKEGKFCLEVKQIHQIETESKSVDSRL